MSNIDDLGSALIKRVVSGLLGGKSAAEVFLEVDDLTLKQVNEIESLLKDDQPLIKLKRSETGKPAELSYDVPNSTSYKGRQYLVLSHPKLDNLEWFVDHVRTTP